MQLTDVYSFGLTVWRVLLNCANPFERLPRITTPFNGQNDFVQQMKSNAMFPQVVMQSIEGLHVRFANAVVTATLNLDPAQRSLEAAIYALSGVARNDASQNRGQQRPPVQRSSPMGIVRRRWNSSRKSKL